MQASKKPAISVPVTTRGGAAPEADAWALDDHWPALVGNLADQLTEGVSSMNNVADQLLAKGRISKIEHRALTVPAERIKQSGLNAQQILRFYSGRIRQSHEKVNMGGLVEGVLQERKAELGILGIALRRKLKPVEVLIDPTVAHTFVNAVLDWGLPFGTRIDLRMDLNNWPEHARLQMRVANDGVPPSSHAMPDSLSWMLIRQIALVGGGIEIERTITDEGVSFTALFTRTVQAVDGITAVDLSDEHSSMFKSLSGTYVLTISPSLQIRADVRDALREIGIVSDSVVDFNQARDAIKARMPNLIVVDSEIKDEAFELFRRDLLREVFDFPFVE
ncbi:MAG: hypothetical protein MUF55_13015, partial [Hydrogenophaga sp.]|nr:hypothetical protein [Hydrogenophaga sp.]